MFPLREVTNPVVGLRRGVAIHGIMTGSKGIVLVPLLVIMMTASSEAAEVTSEIAT